MMSSQYAGKSFASGVAPSPPRSDGHYLARSGSKGSKLDSEAVEGASRADESFQTTAAGGRARTQTERGATEAGDGGGERGFSTFAYYVVTSDGDDYVTPNAFRIPKRSTCVTLRDVKDYFPLPGTYHFRFKVRVKEAACGGGTDHAGGRHRLPQQPFVWLDVLEDCHLLPLYDHRIYIKATRLSWQQETRPTEAAGTAETSCNKRGDRQPAFNREKSSSTVSTTDAPSRQQHHVASAAAAQQQQHDSGGPPPRAAQEQLLVGGIGGHYEGFPAAAPAPAAAPRRQQQAQQPLRWGALDVERKTDSAAAAANMLLLDEDLPSSRGVREPPASAAKGRLATMYPAPLVMPPWF